MNLFREENKETSLAESSRIVVTVVSSVLPEKDQSGGGSPQRAQGVVRALIGAIVDGIY